MILRGRRKEDSLSARIWSRSERVFEEAGRWYFYTREGTVQGPFVSKYKALEKLDIYIRLMLAELSPDVGQVPSFELSPR